MEFWYNFIRSDENGDTKSRGGERRHESEPNKGGRQCDNKEAAWQDVWPADQDRFEVVSRLESISERNWRFISVLIAFHHKVHF